MKRLIAALVFALLILAGCGGGGSERVLPDQNLKVLSGGEYYLREVGQPRALNLWATWCAPCRAELPAFDDVASRVQGVDIIGVNTGDSGDDAADLVEELGLSFTQVLDPSASLQQGLRITGMPATIFVDGSGTIVDVHNGELDTDELETLLTDLFGATFDSQ